MTTRPDILAIGSAHWDLIGRATRPVAPGADLPGAVTLQPGGVALNIAVALSAQGLRPALLTAVGRDTAGDELLALAGRLGVDCAFAHRSDRFPTGRYVAVEDPGGLVAAIADARALEDAGSAILAPLAGGHLIPAGANWAGPVVIDSNLPVALLRQIAASDFLRDAGLRLAAASPAKAGRLAPFLSAPNATFYLNLAEAAALAGTHLSTAREAVTALLGRGAAAVVVTAGAGPVAFGRKGANPVVQTPPAVPVRRVTGAGDVLMAAHIAAERGGLASDAALAHALAAAAAHIAGEPSP